MIRRFLFISCVLCCVFQINAHAQYADPLKNPWVFTLEEFWPGSERIEGEGITAGLKVPIGDTDKTLIDLWQMEMAKDSVTNMVLHPLIFDESDPSFSVPTNDAIYKTVVILKGNVEVFFGSSETPYLVLPRETIHLMPGTPHKFRALTDAVLMLYCYGDGAAKDGEKDFIRAYFQTGIEDPFTKMPRVEDLACDYTRSGRGLLHHLPFSGPNNEIRESVHGGYIFSNWFQTGDEPGRGSRNFVKVAQYETNNLMTFIEYQWHDFDYYPHDHNDVLELMLITHKKATFWVGEGTENGFIDTSYSGYGKINEEGEEAIPARKGKGIRVEPGYVIYMPTGVPHSMSETEDGNLWFVTAKGAENAGGMIQSLLTENPNKIYQPKESEE